MANYALITGTALETIDLYSDVVRREGLEAVLVRDADETRRIVSEKGRPKLVIADLEVARDGGFQLLREVQSTMPSSDRPVVLAAVSRELRTTAGDLMDALGITEVLPHDADARSLGVAVHRVLAQDTRPTTDVCPPPPAADEEGDQGRAARFAAISLDDSPPDKALQDLVAQTAEVFGVPYALASLTLDDGYWFKAHASAEGSLETRNPGFDASFCLYVVESDQPVLVSEASVHPTFAAHPLVRGGIVASFAGAPLVTRDGDVLGSLCILDSKPGAIGAARVDLLVRLAKRVADEIELRTKARSSALEVIRLNEKLDQERDRHQISKAGLAQLEAILSQLDGGVIVVDRANRIAYANRAAGDFLDMPAHRMTGVLRDDFVRDSAPLFFDHEGFAAKMSAARSALKVFAYEFEQERPSQRLVRWSVKPIELPDGMGQLISIVELDQGQGRALSGRYSVIPPIATTRPTRAPASQPTARPAAGRGKRKV
jgi:PAS domain-containing protein